MLSLNTQLVLGTCSNSKLRVIQIAKEQNNFCKACKEHSVGHIKKYVVVMSQKLKKFRTVLL